MQIFSIVIELINIETSYYIFIFGLHLINCAALIIYCKIVNLSWLLYMYYYITSFNFNVQKIESLFWDLGVYNIKHKKRFRNILNLDL